MHVGGDHDRIAALVRHRAHATDRLTAVVAVVREDCASAPAPAIVVEAVADGWWYTAPIPGARRVVVRFGDTDLGVRGARDAARFVDALGRTRHVGPLVDGDAWSIPPTLHAAGSTRLTTPAGPGWLAVGDAAAAFDPLSAQGILTALLMGREAGRTVAAIIGGAREPEALASYVATYGEVVAQYRHELAAAYTAETRWADQPFWARRRARSAEPYAAVMS